MRNFFAVTGPLVRSCLSKSALGPRGLRLSGVRALSTPAANDAGSAPEGADSMNYVSNAGEGDNNSSDGTVVNNSGVMHGNEVIRPVFDEFGRAYGTGRRKTGVARVWIKEGSGQFTVNGKFLHEYFQPVQRRECTQALHIAGLAGMYDVWCTVKGGGMTGQAGAIRLGTARALKAMQPELRLVLSRAGMLTRDPRMVERKKPGQKKARKKFQWVKR